MLAYTWCKKSNSKNDIKHHQNQYLMKNISSQKILMIKRKLKFQLVTSNISTISSNKFNILTGILKTKNQNHWLIKCQQRKKEFGSKYITTILITQIKSWRFQVKNRQEEEQEKWHNHGRTNLIRLYQQKTSLSSLETGKTRSCQNNCRK